MKKYLFAGLLLLLPFIAVARTGGDAKEKHGDSYDADVHWGYAGDIGPRRWADLSESYKKCRVGKNQSPINIGRFAKAKLDRISFRYRKNRLKVLNNGHTIQVNISQGSYIKIGKERYNLLQFHFHTPSEHRYRGKSYPLEAHFVHKSRRGELAVVGVLFKQQNHNPELKKIRSYMPKKAGQRVQKRVTINLDKLLPKNRSYYHYSGSLTTPPCSEGVRWFVLKKPMTASRSQILAFTDIIGKNARPVQRQNRRVVFTN